MTVIIYPKLAENISYLVKVNNEQLFTQLKIKY